MQPIVVWLHHWLCSLQQLIEVLMVEIVNHPVDTFLQGNLSDAWRWFQGVDVQGRVFGIE